MYRKEFPIPSDGLGGFQHHFFVQQLVDIQKAASSKVPCEVCLEESDEGSDKISIATMYCVDCTQKLCEQCCRPHRRMKSGAHQVIPLKTEMDKGRQNVTLPAVSEQHDKYESIGLYEAQPEDGSSKYNKCIC